MADVLQEWPCTGRVLCMLRGVQPRSVIPWGCDTPAGGTVSTAIQSFATHVRLSSISSGELICTYRFEVETANAELRRCKTQAVTQKFATSFRVLSCDLISVDICALSVLAYTNRRDGARRQTLETACRQQCPSAASQLIPDSLKDCCAVHEPAIAATSPCSSVVTECPCKSAYRTLSLSELTGVGALRP